MTGALDADGVAIGDGLPDPAYQNDYTRYSVEGTVRAGNFEVMAAYVMGEDENWNLDATDVEIEFDGVSVVGGYMFTLPDKRLLHTALQYDVVNSSDVASLEKEFVTPSISCFPVENVRLGLYGRIDTKNSGDDANHSVFANVRTMF